MWWCQVDREYMQRAVPKEGSTGILVLSVQGLEARAFIRQHKYCLLFTTPPVPTSCLPDITTCDHFSQAFPLCVCMIKDWRWEWPGNEASLLWHDAKSYLHTFLNTILQYIVAGTWRGIDVSIRITKEKAVNKDVLCFIDEAMYTSKYASSS